MADTLGQFFRAPQYKHSEDPAVLAAMEGNSSGYFEKLTALDVGFNAAIMVPGIGPVTFDSYFSHHGGKVGAGLDIHLLEAIQQRATQVKFAAKEAGVRYLNDQVRRANQKLSAAALTSTKSALSNRGMPAAWAHDILNEPDRGPLSTTTGRKSLVEDYQVAHEQMLDARTEHDLQRLYNRQASLQSVESDRLRGPFANPRPVYNSDVGTDADRGYFEVQTSPNDQSPLKRTTPDDDQVYVPLVFTDLRPLQGGRYRTVYFAPFITNLSEAYAPSWNMQNFFGRVDPVATYQSTNRTINLGFKIVTLDPSDLKLNYQKLTWLKSMVYPLYSGMQYQQGPVCRMRVGDVINALGAEGNRGVSGIITSLNFDYSDSTWELEKNKKLPREINVTLAFHVLHDTAVGRVGSEFGGVNGGSANLRRIHDAFDSDYVNKKG